MDGILTQMFLSAQIRESTHFSVLKHFCYFCTNSHGNLTCMKDLQLTALLSVDVCNG